MGIGEPPKGSGPPPPPPEEDDDEWVYRRYDAHGVPIKVTNRGVQIDSDRWIDRIVHKIRWNVTSAITGCIFSTVLFTSIFCFVGGLTVFVTWKTIQQVEATMPAKKVPAAAGWRGDGPMVCGGNDVIEVPSTASILPDATAITARGNCQVTLNHVSIVAATAIRAEANATVTVHGGRIEGSEHAAWAGANASITFDGTEVIGPTETRGSATISGLP